MNESLSNSRSAEIWNDDRVWSVIELTQQGHTTCDPVRLGQVAGKLHCDDKVGRVTSRRQDAASLTRLVHRSRVRPLRRQIRTTSWLYPYLRKHVSK